VSSGIAAADLLAKNGFSLFGWDLEWAHDPHTGKPIGPILLSNAKVSLFLMKSLSTPLGVE
jgi:hypothetical protein